jgi:glycosyltransferase involved in cell wall biosynthesis
MTILPHDINKGYGAAQKTGYNEALRRNANIVILVHADNQYDPTLTPQFLLPIINGDADVVTGSRIHHYSSALEAGMPWWKYGANRLLTTLENFIFKTNLSDYHNGFRAYHQRVLNSVPYNDLSNGFDFDTDIIVQCAIRDFRIVEVPHQTRYRDENSQMSFRRGLLYGAAIIRTMIQYKLHELGLWQNKLFSISK